MSRSIVQKSTSEGGPQKRWKQDLVSAHADRAGILREEVFRRAYVTFCGQTLYSSISGTAAFIAYKDKNGGNDVVPNTVKRYLHSFSDRLCDCGCGKKLVSLRFQRSDPSAADGYRYYATPACMGITIGNSHAMNRSVSMKPPTRTLSEPKSAGERVLHRPVQEARVTTVAAQQASSQQLLAPPQSKQDADDPDPLANWPANKALSMAAIRRHQAWLGRQRS